MWRTAGLGVAAVVTVLGLACGGGPGSEGGGRSRGPAATHHVGGRAPRPPIVLLTIDTLRADHLPFYGAVRDTAPTLTRLAAGAVVYDRASSTSSWTVPSVVSWLTGVYPFTHGVVSGVSRHGRIYEQEVIPETLRCLPEVLSGLGYHTMGVTANAHLDEAHGFGRGFDRFSCLGFTDAPAVTRVVESWLAVEEPGRPFFLWIHFFDPHSPYVPREPWFHRFAPGVTEHEMAMLRRAHATWPKIPAEIQRNRPRYLKLARDLYDSEIAFCDRGIGRILERFPWLERAWIVFASDHGEEFFEHGALGHGRTLFEETLRVPLFVRPPGGGDGKRVEEPVSAVDIPRTILAIAGARTDEQWQGHVLPSLPLPGSGPRNEPPLAHLARFPDTANLAAIVGARWKLIRDLRTGELHLYDLRRDPGERRDLATADRTRAASMDDRLEAMVRALPEPPDTPTRRRISKAREEQLRSLGYLR